MLTNEILTAIGAKLETALGEARVAVGDGQQGERTQQATNAVLAPLTTRVASSRPGSLTIEYTFEAVLHARSRKGAELAGLIAGIAQEIEAALSDCDLGISPASLLALQDLAVGPLGKFELSPNRASARMNIVATTIETN